MNEVERYLDQVCRSLRGSSSFRRHIREELREHLSEAIETHAAEGFSHEEAVARAIAEFGSPASVGRELEAVYGRRLFSVVIEKAMAWKERTMKTDWKWSFVAQVALLAVIAAQLALTAVIVTYVMPIVQMTAERMDRPLPGILATAMNAVRFFNDTAVVWLVALAAGAAAFELFCRAENKSMIRLSAAGGLALASIALLWTVSFATTVPLGIMVQSAIAAPPESRVRRHAARAETAYRRLLEAFEGERWSDVVSRARELEDAFEELREFGPASPVLIVLDRQDDLDRIRVLLRRLEDLSEEVASTGDPREESAASLLLLREAYDELVQQADGWPAARAAGDGG